MTDQKTTTPRTEREFHDIHVRHEVAHLLAFREAKCFSEKLEKELTAANEREEAYKQVAEEFVNYTEHSNHLCTKRNCVCGLSGVDAKLDKLKKEGCQQKRDVYSHIGQIIQKNGITMAWGLIPSDAKRIADELNKNE